MGAGAVGEVEGCRDRSPLPLPPSPRTEAGKRWVILSILALERDQKKTQEGKKLWEEMAWAASKSLPTPPWSQHGHPGAGSPGLLSEDKLLRAPEALREQATCL